MPRRPTFTTRWMTALTWPVGIARTSWDYMWRTTVVHRREFVVEVADAQMPPPLPGGVSHEEVQGPDDGAGPLFHRRYATEIRNTALSPEELLAHVVEDLNAPAPTTFARFHKVTGEPLRFAVGDEYVVRMPGPWDGPVRVVAHEPTSFRLATLEGHLEAGQIEFRACRGEHGRLRFEIESWARSGDRLSNLLYHHLRMAKEVQLHMWMSFLEGIVGLSGGRMTGGIDVVTHRVEEQPEQLLRRGAELAGAVA